MNTSAFGVVHKGIASSIGRNFLNANNAAKVKPLKSLKPRTPIGRIGPEDMLKPGAKVPTGNAHHGTAIQSGLQAGDKDGIASARWASQQNLRQSAGKAVNRANGY